MSGAKSPGRLKSALAVVAGILVVFILSTAVDFLMHGIGVFPGWGRPMSGALFLLATAYRVVFGIAGGYVTARLAPARPMRLALIYGFVGVILSTAGAAGTWNKGPEFGPKWYPLLLIATSFPCAWAGGKLSEKRS
jgi:hypothetical protein